MIFKSWLFVFRKLILRIFWCLRVWKQARYPKRNNPRFFGSAILNAFSLTKIFINISIDIYQ